MIDCWEILRADSLGTSRRRIIGMMNRSSHHTLEATLQSTHSASMHFPFFLLP